MQIALRVTAYKLLVLCESDVALDDSSALTTGCTVGSICMLGVLEGSAAVCEDEVGRCERAFRAALELLLQRTLVHVIDQKVWSIADLDVELGMVVLVAMFLWMMAASTRQNGSRGQAEDERRSYERAHLANMELKQQGAEQETVPRGY